MKTYFRANKGTGYTKYLIHTHNKIMMPKYNTNIKTTMPKYTLN